MEYIYAFRSRTNALRFFDALKKERVEASLINTPKSAGVGCGLSVKVRDFLASQKVFSLGFNSFIAVFRLEKHDGFIKLVKIK